MRRPEPWYRTSKNAWYVQVAGKKHRLAKGPKEETRAAAFDAFYKLMAARPENLPAADRITAAVLFDLFLDHSQKHHEPETYRQYRYFLQRFCDSYGKLAAASLKPFHVSKWLDSNPKWKAARRHAALAPKRALAWADKQGILSPSPLRGLEVEPGNRRDRVLTPDEQKEILAAIKDESFRQFVTAMLLTGCRPGEVARVTAADANLDLGVWVLSKHKTAKKTKKPRIIYLSPDMVELTRTLVAKYPQGPLFRGSRNKSPLTRNGIRCRFRRLREKLPHIPSFVAYNFRATYCTQALEAGVSIAAVAELMGHADTTMISKHYSMLSQKVQHMKDMAKKATGG